jgi:hypothetical protein
MLFSRKALCAVAMSCVCMGSAVATEPGAAGGVDFAGAAASSDAQYAARWVVASRDNRGMPFAIVDKKDAKVYLFTPRGRMAASTPALLGLARGDHSVRGVGDVPVAQIPPEDRTTPAGRFVTEPGHNLDGEDVVWMDYDAGLAIHRLRPGAAHDARRQRLASAMPDAHRVSAGCVVVPVDFYETHVQPMFGTRAGVVYVLPETRSVQEMFAAI